MPLILDKNEMHRWLDPGLKKHDILHFIKRYDETHGSSYHQQEV
jgi:hypothetical protein